MYQQHTYNMAQTEYIQYTKGFPVISMVIVITNLVIAAKTSASYRGYLIALNTLLWLILLAVMYTKLFARAHLYMWYSQLSWVPSLLLPLKVILHIVLSITVFWPTTYGDLPPAHDLFWQREDIKKTSWLKRLAGITD